MDEEDSQDELINRNASQGKGKRAAGWDISGSEEDSDKAGEEMEDEESESGDDDDDDEEEDHLNGEDEEMEEEEEDDSEDDDDDEEEEDSGKAVEGAVAGVSADPAGLSSDEDSEKCPICLNSFHSQPVATPESCEHYFCLDCILEWSKNANSCPVDRIVFNNIYLRKNFGGKVQKMITVHKPVKEGQEEQVDLELEQTSCEVCGGRDREDRLLLCDGCDAGYHMECLTPPLDAVPVEEWFCPGCEANNHRSRGSAEDLSEAESQTSDRPTTSRSRSAPAGPTRAIARTQQSERVRANVNRHRITQARTAQLAPRFLMQSTWLDDTINAVVAGLNTAVYVRNLTPRPASSRRRRRTVKHRKGKKSTVSGEKGKAAGTGGVKRRRRKRRTKSRRKLVVKKQPTSRGRIARSLGIAKPKKGSTLPSVYRPSDQSLGSMRADIGAASFSVYGDPFDLDPFDNGEDEEEAQTQVTSLLDAKRRGLSRSALRSHQPVARPITAGLSRRGLGQSQAEEAAPVPDLLGSILSGQSMLLMDSSDVVINRDGSLKAVKPVSMSSPSMPGSSRGSSSGETGVTVGPGPPGQSPNPGPSFGDQAGPSYSPLNTALPLGSPGPSSSPRNPSPPSPRLTNHSHPQSSSHPSSLGHPRLQPAPPSHRPSHGAGPSHRATNGVGPPHRGHPSTSSPGSPSKSREAPPLQSQAKKAAPPKPVWVDVSVLPRIPKIKRETNGSDGTTRGGSSNGTTRGGSSNGFPESGMQSLAGDRGRQHSVDQPQGRQEEQAARHRPGPSSAFANSFSSSSSSSSGSPGNPLRSASSSSSTICFRINSSGSAWHARPLGNASAMASGSSEEEEAAKRRSRSNQKLAGSRSPIKEEPGERDVYDPFHPTGSESNGSDSEPESRAADCKSQHARSGSRLPDVGSKAGFRKQVKAEALERRISAEGEGGSGEHVKVKKEPEPSGLRDCGGTNHSPQRAPETGVTRSTSPLRHRLVPLKTEKPEPADENSVQTQTSISCLQRRAPSTSASSLPGEKKLKTEVKPEPGDSPARSPSRSSGRGRQVSGERGASREQQSASSSPEPGEQRRGGHPDSGQGGRRKGEEQGSGQAGRRREEEGRERRSRRSGSRERRRRSPSDSCDSGASDRSHRKKRRSHSRDGRRSRSGSDSSSREPGKSKKQKRRSGERGKDCGRVARDKRYARSRSRSTSRERRQDRPRPQPSSSGSKSNVESSSRDRERPQSRSRSRERRKGEGSSTGSSKKTAPTLPTSDFSTEQQGKKSEKKASGTSSAKERPEKETKREASSSNSGPTSLSVSGVKEERNHSEARPDGCASAKPIKETKKAKAIKKERLTCFDIFGEESPDDEPVPAPPPVKDEKPPASSLCAIKDFYLKKEKEIKKERMCSPKNEPCSSATSDKEERASIAAIKVKTEPLWPDLSIGSGVPPPPPPPPPPALVLPFTSPNATPAPLVAVPADVPPPPPVPKVKTETPASAPAGPLTAGPPGEEPSHSDEEFNVDVMLDNLDVVKREKAAETEGVPAGSEVKQEREEVKTEGESVPVLAGAKSKAPVKRVTWNIQEPEGPQPERTGSKLALYKLKLKQEGARRPSSNQDPSGAPSSGDPSAQVFKKGSARNVAQAGLPIPGQGQSTAALSEARTPDEPRNDKYMKKLHMQERAVEEVKLAIKPFYQKRDITKDEYKEILRKAVQKVCHSKSREINPVKVANLVKAYVDKYKHARKHGQGREDEEPAQGPETEGAKDSESP